MNYNFNKRNYLPLSIDKSFIYMSQTCFISTRIKSRVFNRFQRWITFNFMIMICIDVSHPAEIQFHIHIIKYFQHLALNKIKVSIIDLIQQKQREIFKTNIIMLLSSLRCYSLCTVKCNRFKLDILRSCHVVPQSEWRKECYYNISVFNVSPIKYA